MNRVPLTLATLATGAAFVPAARAIPPEPCPVHRVIYQQDGDTYVNVPDPTRRCGEISVVIPGSVRNARPAPPCPVRAIVEPTSTGADIVLRDPTKPCGWIVIPVEIPANG
jgi:hypothetical protein